MGDIRLYTLLLSLAISDTEYQVRRAAIPVIVSLVNTVTANLTASSLGEDVDQFNSLLVTGRLFPLRPIIGKGLFRMTLSDDAFLKLSAVATCT